MTTETIYFGTDEIRFSAGKFRTSRRYLRAVSSGATTVVAKGRTIAATLNSSGQLSWRYDVHGVALEYTGAGAITFTASVQAVKV